MPIPELETIVTKLNAEREKLVATLESTREDQRRQPIYESGWTLYEIAAHIASAEKENIRFIRQTLEQDGARHLPQGRVFSLDEWNAQAVGKRAAQSWAERMAEMREARQRTLDTIESVTPEQLTHRGTHAVWGEKSAEGMFKILYLHDIMHRGDVSRQLGS